MHIAPSPHVTCLADLVRVAAQRDPSAIAIEHDRGRLTYAQFWERAVRLANAMLCARPEARRPRRAVRAELPRIPRKLHRPAARRAWSRCRRTTASRRRELSYLLDNSGASGAADRRGIPAAPRRRCAQDGKRVPGVVIVYGDASGSRATPTSARSPGCRRRAAARVRPERPGRDLLHLGHHRVSRRAR